MTVVRQSEWEELDGFQVDYDQFLVPYSLGHDIVDVLSLHLLEAAREKDRLTVVAIIWFMLLATGLPLPVGTFSCRCDPLKVESLIRSLNFEARCGELEGLYTALTDTARAAGIYGPLEDPHQAEDESACGGWNICPSKN